MDRVAGNAWRWMDFVLMRNLLYFLLGVLIALTAGIASAAAPVNFYMASTDYGGVWSSYHAEFEPACSALVARLNARQPTGFTARRNGTTGCSVVQYNGNTYMGGLPGSVSIAQRCAPDGTAPDTTKPLAQRCGDPAPVCTAGKQIVRTLFGGYSGIHTGNDLPTSVDGCAVEVVDLEDCKSNGKDATGKTPVFCKFTLKETGQTVVPGDSSVADLPSTAKPEEVPRFSPGTGQGCPAGTVNMGTDSSGGSICGGSGTSPSTPPKTETTLPPTTVTNPDGGTTKTQVTTSTNGDGSVTTTTTKTTTGGDGKITIEVTSTTGAGSGGGGGKADSNDFCAKNPTLAVCRNSTVAGECGETSCQGDAIQCAILRAQRKQQCDWSTPDDVSRLGEQMMNGNDPLKGTFPTKENARVVNVPQLNKDGFLGGGACFTDVDFTIQGHQFVVPLAKLCDYLIVLRGIVMLLASLASWKLISRSILG